MSPARQILFLIILILFCATGFAQRERIDSLKKILPLLHDSTRVDCLNELSEAFLLQQGNGYIPYGLTIINMDSARLFARQALSEAEKTNYSKGQCKAYTSLGRIEGRLYDDYAATDNYFTRALEFALQLNDDGQLARAYGYMAWVKWIEGRFPEAMVGFKKAAYLFEKLQDTTCLSETWYFMSAAEQESGNYSEALKYALKFQELSGKEPFALLCRLYESIGDYETALYYAQNDPGKSADKVANMGIGNIFYLMKQYDSAMHYFQLSAKNTDGYRTTYFGKLYSRWGALYTALRQYDTALAYLKKALPIHKISNDGNEIMRVLLALSSTYKEKGNARIAMTYACELFQFASQAGARQYIRDGHLLLFELYNQLQIQDSAYYHLRQYTVVKDSIDLELSAQKLAFYKIKSEREQTQSKINTLNDEKKLQHQKLKQTAQQKNFLIAGIVAILLIAALVLRNILLKRKNERRRRELAENELLIQQLENEKTKAELQQQATELEMQALRSQMNPHFIFNCLSSINRFILKNESEIASDYLTKFSRLMRMVLNNSQKMFVNLDDELEMLRLYLDLERLRFKNSFDYSISFHNHFDASSIFIPPLLLQPFAENAIWHGLMNKTEPGILEIAFELENNILNCYITDNGVGRKRAETLKSKSAEKQKSMGIQITAGRLALLNKDAEHTVFNVEDLVDANGQAAGTRVTLKIKYKESIEEFS